MHDHLGFTLLGLWDQLQHVLDVVVMQVLLSRELLELGLVLHYQFDLIIQSAYDFGDVTSFVLLPYLVLVVQGALGLARCELLVLALDRLNDLIKRTVLGHWQVVEHSALVLVVMNQGSDHVQRAIAYHKCPSGLSEV